MKKKIFLIPILILACMCSFASLKANHLDGLWRSDRSQITLSIEQEDNGFKAKRSDQGVWYHYTTEDNQHYTDRHGNWYELVDDNQLIWNEANSTMSIYFSRIDDRNDNRWNNNGNNYDRYNNAYNNSWNNRGNHDGQYGNSDGGNWNKDNHFDNWNSLDGSWYAGNGRGAIQITSFERGIRIKYRDDGWEKFYTDGNSRCFRDRDGDVITVLDRNNLKFKSGNGRHEEIFTRYRDWNHDRNDWRDK